MKVERSEQSLTSRREGHCSAEDSGGTERKCQGCYMPWKVLCGSKRVVFIVFWEDLAGIICAEVRECIVDVLRAVYSFMGARGNMLFGGL